MKVERKWGWWIMLFEIDSMWIKLIRVLPNRATSIQKHFNRTEYHLSFHQGLKIVKPLQVHEITEGWYIEIATGRPCEEDIIRYN